MEPQVYEHPSGWKVSLNKGLKQHGWCVEMWDGIELYEGVYLPTEAQAAKHFAWMKSELQRRIHDFGTWIVPDEAERVIKS